MKTLGTRTLSRFPDSGSTAWHRRAVSIVTASCIVFGFANVVFAQSDDGLVLEEVLVTATKRSTSLQDVGVAVSAFSGEDLERLGITSSEEVLLRVPNLEIQANAGSTNANIFLRGVGSTGMSFNLQSGVGIYADEVVLNSPVVNILQVYDLERVEVLRGPQNTLYGRNTTGGAVNFISRKPIVGGETNGYISGSYGLFNEVNLEGAVGASMGEKAAFRFSVQSQTRDGIRTNLLTGNDDVDRDKFATRLQLAFEPSERVSVSLKAHVERVRSGNLRFKLAGSFDPNDPTQPCATPYQLGACADASGFVDTADPLEFSSNMVDPENDVDAFGVSAQINIDFENFTLTSITAYEENEAALSEDSDASPAHEFHFWIDSEAEQFSQELRLASNDDADFRWIVGAYGFWEDKEGNTGPTFGTPMGTMVVRSGAQFDNTSYSAYADLEYEVSEKFALKGGLRFGSDNIKGSSVAVFAFESALGGLDFTTPSLSGAPVPTIADILSTNPGIAAITVGGPDNPDDAINDTTFNEWGGELGVEYRPNDDVLVYAQWSRGFKAGSFPNAPMAIMTGLGDTPIEPEIVNVYELGVKSEFADGRALLNAAIFYNDYQDQQIAEGIPLEGGGTEFRVLNVDSEIFGLEVDFDWLLAKGTFINFSLGYLDTKITKGPENDPAFAGTPIEGNKLPQSPKLSGSAEFRKDWQLTGGATVGIGINGRYSGERVFDLTNDRGNGSYIVMNAQAYYEFGSDNDFRVTLWGKNINNELYYNNMFEATLGGRSVYLSEPRTYGITLIKKF